METPMNDPQALNERARALAAQLIRNFDAAALESYTREPLYQGQGARLATGTVARKLGASIDILAPGMRGCPYHSHHAQEEMFVVIKGHGTLRVAGEMLPIKTGDVIFVPPGPEYPHQIINTSAEPLQYLSVSTRETPEICEYPDSGKHMAWVANGPQSQERPFSTIQRSGPSLDYWDGEP
jgi:uncharacterized cupin superfamily protein